MSAEKLLAERILKLAGEVDNFLKNYDFIIRI